MGEWNRGMILALVREVPVSIPSCPQNTNIKKLYLLVEKQCNSRLPQYTIKMKTSSRKTANTEQPTIFIKLTKKQTKTKHSFFVKQVGMHRC